MAKEGHSSLKALMGAIPAAAKNQPPVDSWDPPYCGDIDMRIAADGTWYYQKSPIRRPALVKLFASLLKREGDRYFLVTPAEKCGIIVDDAPFLAVDMRVEDSDHCKALRFFTNVGDEVLGGSDHALRFERQADTGGLVPYLHVRRGLWAAHAGAVLRSGRSRRGARGG